MAQASLEKGGGCSDDEDERPERRRGREEREDRGSRAGDRGYYGEPPELGLASLLAKPDVLAAVNLIGQLGGGLGGFGGLGQVRLESGLQHHPPPGHPYTTNCWQQILGNEIQTFLKYVSESFAKRSN